MIEKGTKVIWRGKRYVIVNRFPLNETEFIYKFKGQNRWVVGKEILPLKKKMKRFSLFLLLGLGFQIFGQDIPIQSIQGRNIQSTGNEIQKPIQQDKVESQQPVVVVESSTKSEYVPYVPDMEPERTYYRGPSVISPTTPLEGQQRHYTSVRCNIYEFYIRPLTSLQGVGNLGLETCVTPLSSVFLDFGSGRSLSYSDQEIFQFTFGGRFYLDYDLEGSFVSVKHRVNFLEDDVIIGNTSLTLGVKRVYLRRFSVSIEGGLGREVMNQTISTVPVVGLSLGLRL